MAAPADPSLLSAELEAEEGDDEALRRLLLQATQDDEEQHPAAPSRAVTPQPGGQGCTAYDVVVNSGFFRTLQADPLYLEFFLTVAMEGLSEKYGVELELTGWRVLKNRKFMGSVSAQNIRARPRPHIQELEGPLQDPPPPPSPPGPPQFVVVAEPSSEHPQVLQARILLPHAAGAGSLWLGLSEERLVLRGAEGAPHLLELGLPLPADPARCHARFHRGTKVLTVTMPLQV
ncbi:PIH1 domain-containing protein 1 isoform X2 [Phalacrocorax aristotelis]|uniref:PIH1 domain-containing protein 1 isoform X2 n=1 Tax=Phalacrocorax aristotelis TaxID=126867 RepID=UPI003F4C9F03